jgi:hypothetical protein
VATEVWYCTREDVKRALDIKETARTDGQVDRAIASSSGGVEGLLHRRFYPWTGTRYFDWPNHQYARPWRLWLDDNELISVTTLATGGTVIPASDYFPRRSDMRDEPPYTHIEVDLDSSAAFGGGDTHQRDIAITGVWGHSLNEAPAGVLAEALDATETDVDVTNGAAIGVGQIIRVDTERMIVTGRGWLDTGQDLGGSGLTDRNNDVTVPVSVGSAFTVDEVLLIGSERLLVTDVAGNNLTVKRAWDGSVLAAHPTGADIYASRTLTVERGALGTTAAAHSSGAAVAKHVFPSLVQSLAVAEAIVELEQEKAAYARTVGSGDNQREAAGRGIKAIRDEAYRRYGRKARVRAI